MRTKAFATLLALPLLAATFAASAQNSPYGRWKTIDDETGKPMTRAWEASADWRNH
jgi:hypothetical protein